MSVIENIFLNSIKKETSIHVLLDLFLDFVKTKIQIKKNCQMACWLEQPTTSNKDFYDEIDEIMKHEHEDVILLDEALSSGAPLELGLDSITDFLDTPATTLTNPSSTISPMSPPTLTPTTIANTDYTQPLNIYNMPSTSCATFPNNNNNNNSQSNAASAYSALGISPQFTTLSIHQRQHPFSPPTQDTNNSSTMFSSFGQIPVTINSKNSLHPTSYIGSQQQQSQDSSVLGTSYPFELQVNNGPLDVKRFRSASMNDGATQQHQQNKLGKIVIFVFLIVFVFSRRSFSIRFLSFKTICIWQYSVLWSNSIINKYNNYNNIIDIITCNRYIIE